MSETLAGKDLVIIGGGSRPDYLMRKIVELAVRDIIHGRPIKNKEALANPEALDLYQGLPELGA